MDDPSDVQLSKKLSWLLRHGAVKKGISLDEEGYAKITNLLALNEFKKFTLEQILYVVEHNDKKRFAVKECDGTFYIRANQGHSNNVVNNSGIVIDKLLKRLDKPLPTVIHGTTKDAYPLIIRSGGLKKMGRSHVHFAISEDYKPDIQTSGIRYNAEVLIYIDMKKAMDDGLTFYISDNDVVLCAGTGNEGLVSSKYFSKVVDKLTKERLL